MNLDELKTAWKAYDEKLKASQRIQETLIISMITTRSASRFSSVRKKYLIGITWMTFCLIGGIIILATNPFDYRYLLQYFPMLIFILSLSVLIGGMMKSYLHLYHITVETETLEASLKGIIAEYQKPQRLMNYTLIILLFTAVVLFPLSFLPANVNSMGLGIALAERFVPIAISGILLFIAFKLGAFRERNAPHFKEDLSELEQLKAMSKELADIA